MGPCSKPKGLRLSEDLQERAKAEAPRRPPAPNTQKTTSFSVHAACYLNIYELSPPAVKKLLINYSSHKSWTKVPSNCQNAFKNPSVLNITV